MITLFRFNTFFHVFTVFGILLLLKLPMMLHGLPVLAPELEWQLIGERLVEGKALYREIWTNVGPLSAYSYGFVTLLFGRDVFNAEMLAFFLVFLQALYINYMVNNRRVLLEKTFLPALLYILVMSLSFDTCKLSPALMGNTFLLFALNSIFKQIDRGEQTSQYVFEVGIFIGIGTLFVYSYPVFLFWALLSLILFTPFKANQLFLILLGFFMPLIVALLFFYFAGSAEQFIREWALQVFDRRPQFDQSTINTILLFAFPVALAVLGILRLLNYTRYANFQTRKHQILVVYGVFALINYVFACDSSTFNMLALVPFLAIFTAGWFLHMRGTYTPELFFLVFAFIVVFASFQGVKPLLGRGFEHLQSIRIDKTATPAFAKGQKILVTGEDIAPYFNAQLGAVYLSWPVSKNELEQADVYQHIASVYGNFEREKPSFILDKAEVFPEIFKRIPSLESLYEPMKGQTNVYKLKK
ncbi:hypothetical protein LAG90_05920 [Marinilongibacter aquaticus]|uniref:DUF6427 family protein n=1 Tax=Marinilongibacter aquaticus TaxID=2975157 RepID=UPI0021BD830A|nr:hypothetical protein [Marinilongibacter aquaticus]UBM60178.1 hypothetical protein LAG90_05920 [Marinilongibacter aquaticus]